MFAIFFCRRSSFRPVGGFLLVLLGFLLCPARLLAQQEPHAEYDGGVFLPIERTARQRFAEAQQMISAGRYAEAVRFLGAILEGPEDSFYRPTDPAASYRSLKAEARRIIGDLPPGGRDAYQLQFGPRAKSLLEEGIKAADLVKIAEVSRRFFHTEAGYDATLLMAQVEMDHARWLAAALSLDALLDSSVAVSRFGPGLYLRGALSWQRGGKPERSKELLAELKKKFPGTELELGGRRVPLFPAGGDVLAWLESNFGEPSDADKEPAAYWAMHRGNAQRNASADGGRPLLAHRWEVRTFNDPWMEELVESMKTAYSRQGIVTIPSLQPLAVGDVVLIRGSRQLLAVDFASGKRVWEVKPNDDKGFENLVTASRTQIKAGQVPMLATALEERVWDDGAYGSLSSDGERVYSIEGLELPISPLMRSSRFVVGFGGRVGFEATASNRLAAHELATEGKLAWEVGGVESDDEMLREAFFLGPPLPLADSLYVIAEIKGGIRLIVLEAKTGRLLWSQQLADVERNVTQDPYRRLAGATPSYSDGVMVCPTSAGAVVAVNLASRSLLWAFSYPQQEDRDRHSIMRSYQSRLSRTNNRWIDASVTISEGKVLLTPVEADRIICLDLVTGSKLWEQPRDDNLFVGCVDKGLVFLIGVRDCHVLRLADGKAKGEEIELPDGSLPSGRGFYSDGKYYLPLDSGAVARIDFATGKMLDVTESRSGEAPSNVICHRGQVLSLGATSLQKFFQIEPLEAWVKTTLAENPQHFEANVRAAQIAWDRGASDDAIGHYRQAWAQRGEADVSDAMRLECQMLYTESLLDGLRRDYARYRETIPELAELIDEPEQRFTLARLIADGLRREGDTWQAFQHYLELIDSSSTAQSQYEQIDDNHVVLRDRWIQRQLASLYQRASAEVRSRMDAAIGKRMDAAPADLSEAELLEPLRYFGSLPAAARWRLESARRMLNRQGYLEAEIALADLLESDNASHAMTATAYMAEALWATGHIEQGRADYLRLTTQFADIAGIDGRTGREVVAALPPETQASLLLPAAHTWPVGRVEGRVGRADASQNAFHRRLFPLEIRGPQGRYFRGGGVVFDQQQPSVICTDSQGAAWCRVPLNARDPRSRSYFNPSFNHAAVQGHLLVLTLGMKMMAIDTLSAKSGTPTFEQHVLWEEDLADEFTNRLASSPPRRVLRPGGIATYQAGDSSGSAIFNVGPVQNRGVIFQRYSELLCLDPITGEMIWTREDIADGSELFGDEERLFVVAPDADEALVIDSQCGELLGRRKIPPIDQRLGSWRGDVLVWSQTNSGVNLSLLDLWSGKAIWSHDNQAGSQAWRVDDDEIAVMQPAGQFAIYALADGKPRVSQQLEPEPVLTGIYVFRSNDNYLLITNRPTRPGDRKQRSTAVLGGLSAAQVNGSVYSFSRSTGRPLWSVPAHVSQRGILLPQPPDVPLLTFVNVIEKSGPKTTSVLCIDKRTGREVYRNDDLKFETSYYQLSADPATKTVTLSLQSSQTKTIELTLTADPLPPEPTVQEGGDYADATPKDSSVFGILRSVGRAQQRAGSGPDAGDIFGGSDDADDLFNGLDLDTGEQADDK